MDGFWLLWHATSLRHDLLTHPSIHPREKCSAAQRSTRSPVERRNLRGRKSNEVPKSRKQSMRAGQEREDEFHQVPKIARTQFAYACFRPCCSPALKRRGWGMNQDWIERGDVGTGERTEDRWRRLNRTPDEPRGLEGPFVPFVPFAA